MRILQLLEEFIALKWGGVKHLRGRKMKGVSTNDLDADGKLRPDFLEDRKLRKKEGDKPKSYGYVDYE